MEPTYISNWVIRLLSYLKICKLYKGDDFSLTVATNDIVLTIVPVAPVITTTEQIDSVTPIQPVSILTSPKKITAKIRSNKQIVNDIVRELFLVIKNTTDYRPSTDFSVRHRKEFPFQVFYTPMKKTHEDEFVEKIELKFNETRQPKAKHFLIDVYTYEQKTKKRTKRIVVVDYSKEYEKRFQTK